MGERSPLPGRLRSARLKADLTQKELGIRAGMDEFSASARINQYEKGKHTPDFQIMEGLAQVLGVPAPYFYCRDSALADLVLTYGTLSASERKKLVRQLTDLLKEPSL